jgi:hypothetical protein
LSQHLNSAHLDHQPFNEEAMPTLSALDDSHDGKLLATASLKNSDIMGAPNSIVRFIYEIRAHLLGLTRTVLALFVTLAILPTMAHAGGGNVLPPTAKPRGYSLSDMAVATSFFNTRPDRTPQNAPDTPFQVLYVPENNNLTFEVRPGTMLYVPVLYLDDSPPIVGDFPNIADREDVLHYFYSQNEIGNAYIKIIVDGAETSLGPDYLVGVGPVPLADGPGGTQQPRMGGYIVSAAFLTPLNKGAHTVEIEGNSNGAALIPFFPPNGVWQFSITYTVIVR